MINFISYLVVVLLIFWLMYSWLELYFEFFLFIVIGVYIFGSLNLFMLGFFLFVIEVVYLEENLRECWKFFLEELVVLLVVVFFVIVWGYNGQGVEEVIVLGVLFYVFFLFFGKGLLIIIEKWIGVNQVLWNKWVLWFFIK